MSVARVREINARLRAAGITVHEWAGWEARGNGQTSAYEGAVVHHTASPHGVAYLSLVNGRPDLTGPLCNYAGNADGSITVIAAHPANHAGASGGRSMGPLPVTSTFNRRVLGLEIVYPGTAPMTDAQYRAACAWSRIAVDVLGSGDIERARAHAETSVTGKWDPGYANGKTYDMRQFRADAARSLTETNVTTPAANWDHPITSLQGTTAPARVWQTQAAYWGEIAAGRAGVIDGKLNALGVAVAQIRTRVDSFDSDNDGLVSTEGTAGAEDWAAVVEAAERGAREGVTKDVIARIDELETALQADDGEQARAGAHEVLARLRSALPAE